MHRPARFLRSLAVVAALAVCAAASATVDVVQHAYRRVRDAIDWLASLLVPTASRPAHTATQAPPLRIPMLVAACAFNACMMRREYPHIEQRWRMCPSV